MRDRPSAEIETIAYYCIVELLADTCEHSGASCAYVEIVQRDESLLLQVADDGAGGATVEERSGLAATADYVRSVHGTLSVHSPAGGPTLVTAILPFRV
jgi:signal transduction histidine kinase